MSQPDRTPALSGGSPVLISLKESIQNSTTRKRMLEALHLDANIYSQLGIKQENPNEPLMSATVPINHNQIDSKGADSNNRGTPRPETDADAEQGSIYRAEDDFGEEQVISDWVICEDGISEIPITSYSQYIDVIANMSECYDKKTNNFDMEFVFIGAPTTRSGLRSTLGQLDNFDSEEIARMVEKGLLTNFKRFSSQSTAEPIDIAYYSNVWAMLGLMHKNGCPTRLVEWTSNPNVALFNAVEELKHSNDDGEVWFLRPRDLVRAQRYPFTRELLKHDYTYPSASEHQSILETFNPPVPAADMVASLEKFDDFSTENGPFLSFFRPLVPDANMINRSTLFSVISNPLACVEDILVRYPSIVKRIIIPSFLKGVLHDTLDFMGVQERSLMPGLPGLSASLTRYFTRYPRPSPEELKILFLRRQKDHYHYMSSRSGDIRESSDRHQMQHDGKQEFDYSQGGSIEHDSITKSSIPPQGKAANNNAIRSVVDHPESVLEPPELDVEASDRVPGTNHSEFSAPNVGKNPIVTTAGRALSLTDAPEDSDYGNQNIYPSATRDIADQHSHHLSSDGTTGFPTNNHHQVTVDPEIIDNQKDEQVDEVEFEGVASNNIHKESSQVSAVFRVSSSAEVEKEERFEAKDLPNSKSYEEDVASTKKESEHVSPTPALRRSSSSAHTIVDRTSTLLSSMTSQINDKITSTFEEDEKKIMEEEKLRRERQQRFDALDRIEETLREDIHFDKNSAELSTEGIRTCMKVREILLEYPELLINIDSHTSCSQTEAFNCNDGCRMRQLSQDRVEAIKELFVKEGCTNKFYTLGWGCKHPQIGSVRKVRIYPVDVVYKPLSPVPLPKSLDATLDPIIQLAVAEDIALPIISTLNPHDPLNLDDGGDPLDRNIIKFKSSKKSNLARQISDEQMMALAFSSVISGSGDEHTDNVIEEAKARSDAEEECFNALN